MLSRDKTLYHPIETKRNVLCTTHNHAFWICHALNWKRISLEMVVNLCMAKRTSFLLKLVIFIYAMSWMRMCHSVHLVFFFVSNKRGYDFIYAKRVINLRRIHIRLGFGFMLANLSKKFEMKKRLWEKWIGLNGSLYFRIGQYTVMRSLWNHFCQTKKKWLTHCKIIWILFDR